MFPTHSLQTSFYISDMCPNVWFMREKRLNLAQLCCAERSIVNFSERDMRPHRKLFSSVDILVWVASQSSLCQTGEEESSAGMTMQSIMSWLFFPGTLGKAKSWQQSICRQSSTKSCYHETERGQAYHGWKKCAAEKCDTPFSCWSPLFLPNSGQALLCPRLRQRWRGRVKYYIILYYFHP
mgnify:CR=1 FL=1